MKNLRQIGKSALLGVAVLIALVIYAYGFKVTKVNLDETRSPRRQEQLVRILRALARPDLVTYDQEEYVVNAPVHVPCPAGGYEAPAPNTDEPYMIVTPACVEPGGTVVVKGFNFNPGTTGPLSFIPPSEVSLRMGNIQVGADGTFEIEAKVPKRESDENQYVRAITRKQVGGPKISQTAVDTWDKIVETVFLALLATTIGLLFAVPLSFFAARNLMKDVNSPLTVVALNLLAIPIGLYLGGGLAGWIGGLSQGIDSIVIMLLTVILGPVIAYFGLRWALPQEELTTPTLQTRVIRILGLAAVVFVAIFSLYMLSALAMRIGDALEIALGAAGFLGTFLADLGDILGMALAVITAFVGAGVLSGLAGRLGKFLVRGVQARTAKIVMIALAIISGAAIFILIMMGINWLYQFNKPELIYYWPGVLGALGGLFLGVRMKPRDPFPIGMVIYNLARTIFNALRSIEALIMVIVFVVWVGIGPFAGVLALSLHTVAALAKLYSEQVESILAGPLEAVTATGANRLQTIIYAVIPQIIPPYISFTMYRWDINVRMSTIIGFAGGGGIGFLLIQNINLLNYRAASAQMLAIALVVASMDYLSSALRERTV